VTTTASVHAAVPQRPALPRVVPLAQRFVLVVVAVHLVALALIATHADAFVAAAVAAHPDLGPGAARKLGQNLVLQSVIPHLVLAVVLTLRARALGSGRRRARTLLAVLLGLQMAAHATLPITLHQLPQYAPAVITIQVVSLAFEVAALALLFSRPARRWYGREQDDVEPVARPS
jgi:hypothetical protein